MLKIQGQQMRSLGQAVGLDRFEDEAVPYFQSLVPRHTAMIGEAGLRRVIRLGVKRAAVYGITNHGLLRFYIELMFCFGSAFDTDPLLPWASEVLRDASIGDEVARSKRLYHAMKEYLELVAEPGTAMSIKALRNVREARTEDYRVSDPDFEAKALAGMWRIYPERCEYLGEERLRDAIRRGPEVAAACGIGTDRGVVLAIGLLFIEGHAFATDPLQPWIQATLQNSKIMTPERRAERLERRMRIYLDEVLLHLEQTKPNVQA